VDLGRVFGGLEDDGVSGHDGVGKSSNSEYQRSVPGCVREGGERGAGVSARQQADERNEQSKGRDTCERFRKRRRKGSFRRKLKKDERIKSIRKVASGGKRSKRGAYAHPLLGDEKARKRRTSHPVFGWGDFSPQSGCQGRRLRDQIPTELVIDLTVIPQHTDGTSIDDQPYGSPLHAHY
jgi:hypothetical protein